MAHYNLTSGVVSGSLTADAFVLHTRLAAGTLLVAAVLGLVFLHEGHAKGQPSEEVAGLAGYVLDPDGAPVSGGSVELRFRIDRVTATIAPTGHFQVVPTAVGRHELHAAVPGFAPHRVHVTVPPSRTVRLPVIRLSPPTYFRVQPVSDNGEPIVAPRLLRRFVDITGGAVSGLAALGAEVVTDIEGVMTIGPLPRGVTTLALDAPPFAPRRLPDLHVTGADSLIDGGTVTVDAGATLHVDVVNAAGAPVPAHEVILDELRPLSPLPLRTVRTTAAGRASFERLASGPYRVRTAAAGRCTSVRPFIARIAPVSGRGELVMRIVASGRAMLQLSTPYGPLNGALVRLSPEPAEPPPFPGLRMTAESAAPMAPMSGAYRTAASCDVTTDGNGQAVIDSFPPGAARLVVHLPNSQYERRLTIPEEPREIRVAIPDGLLQVQVIQALNRKPVGTAHVTWNGGGARIEGRAVASGDVLLEGVAATAGLLVVEAPGYERVEVKLAAPPATIYEVPLNAAPASRLQARIVGTSGEPVPCAVVEVTPESPLEIPQIVVTDAKGVLMLSDLPPGPLQLSVHADGFATSVISLPADARDGFAVTLSRGYRATVNVELPSGDPYLIRVVDETGASVDGGFDAASARRIESPGRLSLGPLAPGTYVVELQNGRERRQSPIAIVDRDVIVTIR